MATLTINTDEKTAENFYAFCEELGLDMSTAMTLFMKACLREQKIPFELKVAKKEVVQNINIKTKPTTIEELLENYDI
ncbi:type II toxin-antitoxin system RelB/DinJ family antitoxin [Fusobacterium polymorphum]|uniref:Acyltransferase n=1 Tax=Fusobacterium nucleatum subsp. polymorphum TaxID=76857 RepID=A0AAC8WE69_FUSNP|nr:MULTISPECIES: type II toxin-antitoxin system RelB/DinJ family antitoxin [Fusobacterium]ALM93688.1 acyltransferase [Fusobacterium polymorphum]ALQ42299.1 acyltransferase [Fusobacterium polymorphum]MCG6838425.1 type II toxin-antitoxin system RelB/DinJ family antitoxin [Fusobacterium nucleatum]